MWHHPNQTEDVRQPACPGQVLPSSNAHAFSYKGTQTSFTTGQYSPIFFRNSRPKFDMETNQPFQQDNLIITPSCATALKSDRGRASTS